MNKGMMAIAILGAGVATPAMASTTINGTLGPAGVSDYSFSFAGGAFSVAVNSAGGNPIVDPSLRLFDDDGSPYTAKTGTQIAYNDDSFSTLNSYYANPNLAAGNYVLSVGRFFFDESEARSANAGGYAAGTTYDVTFSNGVSLAGAVPEPAAWGLMILGFGAIGGAMRRKAAVRTSVRYA